MTVHDVCIVGGGPSGAALATLLARAGRSGVVLERFPTWRWRACGVFASPAAVAAARRIGLPAADLASLARPIPAMRVETPAGTTFRLTYGDDGSLRDAAVGFDRGAFDRRLLGLARDAGADVRLGTSAGRIDLDGARGRPERWGHVTVSVRPVPPGDVPPETLACRIVVGADGIRSHVARSAGVTRPVPLGRRVGLTFHVRDPRPDDPHDARMVVLPDAYCGLAPVPGGRLNVGIVVGGHRLARLTERGAAAVVEEVLAAVPPAPDDPVDWAAAERCDPIAGAAPVGHRVARRTGPGWLLAGDAAGFLDPFTGEGLHRALVSAELAAEAIDGALRGRGRLDAYDRALDARFRTKDLVTLLVQAFLSRPALFEYAARRLATRPTACATMGLVIGDLVPAGRAFDPRFLARLLAP